MEPGALEHDVHQVLPDVVDVALDRAHDDLADGLRTGLGEQWPQHLQRAGHRLARDEHFRDEEVAALEPGADFLQRRDQRVVEQVFRAEPHPQAGVGEVKDRGRVAHQGVIVKLLEKLFLGHAAPAFCAVRASCGRYPSTTDRAAASWTQRPAAAVTRSRARRLVGPDTEMAATTAPSYR